MHKEAASEHAKGCRVCREYGSRWCQAHSDIMRGQTAASITEPCTCGAYEPAAVDERLCGKCGCLAFEPDWETYPGFIVIDLDSAGQASIEQSRAEVRALLGGVL